MQDFRKFAVLFFEILHHEVRLFTREQFIAIAFRYLPPGILYLMMPKSLFIIKNRFSDLKLYFLHISAIFNKKKNSHISNFHDQFFKLWQKGKNKKSQSLEAIA